MAMRKSLPADVILFYRLGDFYEMFFEDAKSAAPILNVALTKRGGTPMCGVPYHAAQAYIARLLKAGKHWRRKFPTGNSPVLYHLRLCEEAMGEATARSVSLQEKAVSTSKPQSPRSWPQRRG
jgi:hypothetical protein